MHAFNQNILVIGATSDIGQSICTTLASSEIHLIVHGRDPLKLQSLTTKLSDSPATVSTQLADLEDLQSVAHLCDQIKKDYEKIDWIIFSAGYITPLEEQGLLSLAEINKTFSVNTISAIEITARLESIISNPGGVLFISSTAGLWGNSKFPMYSSSKAAITNFGKSLAKRWEPSKRAIIICPGPTNTHMRERIAQDASLHQDVSVVADTVQRVMYDADSYPTGSIIEIRNNVLKKILDT